MFFVSHILSNYQGLIVSMVPEFAKRNATPSCTKATQRSASSIYVAWEGLKLFWVANLGVYHLQKAIDVVIIAPGCGKVSATWFAKMLENLSKTWSLEVCFHRHVRQERGSLELPGRCKQQGSLGAKRSTKRECRSLNEVEICFHLSGIKIMNLPQFWFASWNGVLSQTVISIVWDVSCQFSQNLFFYWMKYLLLLFF